MIETICKDDFSGSKCWSNVVQRDKMSKQCCKRVSGEEIFENSSLPREVALFFPETRRVLFHSLHGRSARNSILNWILVVECWKTP